MKPFYVASLILTALTSVHAGVMNVSDQLGALNVSKPLGRIIALPTRSVRCGGNSEYAEVFDPYQIERTALVCLEHVLSNTVVGDNLNQYPKVYHYEDNTVHFPDNLCPHTVKATLVEFPIQRGIFTGGSSWNIPNRIVLKPGRRRRRVLIGLIPVVLDDERFRMGCAILGAGLSTTGDSSRKSHNAVVYQNQRLITDLVSFARSSALSHTSLVTITSPQKNGEIVHLLLPPTSMRTISSASTDRSSPSSLRPTWKLCFPRRQLHVLGDCSCSGFGLASLKNGITFPLRCLNAERDVYILGGGGGGGGGGGAASTLVQAARRATIDLTIGADEVEVQKLINRPYISSLATEDATQDVNLANIQSCMLSPPGVTKGACFRLALIGPRLDAEQMHRGCQFIASCYYGPERPVRQYRDSHQAQWRKVGINYGEVLYNGSFFHEQIYRKDPSPEVDAAWKALGADSDSQMDRALRVPESEAQKSGISLDHVRIKAKYGGGYPANVEGLHHLHCLNLLRKGLIYNYPYYKNLGKGPFSNGDHVVKVHITHCLDILRQQLMCTVDTGVLGQIWVYPENPEPFVDFNTKHTCKNFEAIRRWAEVRQLPESPPDDFLERPGGGIWGEIP
ncbi:tat pathway signal sequence [Venturia nashicola]|nr:tat pathway signal sequence [Venturia nashicola]